jgi:putative ABC transport system permease protein
MIFDPDHWHELLSTLRRNKLRTLLTAFGVFWGTFMLMIMLGSGNGLQNGVYHEFSDVATNSFFIWTEETSKPWSGLPAGREFGLDESDAPAIRREVPQVEIICPRNQLGGYRGANNVARGKRTGAFSIMGDYPEIRKIQPLRIRRGRFLDAADIAERRKTAVIATRVAEVLFAKDEDPIGQNIRISGVYFMVIGVFDTDRSGNDAERDLQTIYVPFTTFHDAFNVGARVGWFAATSSPGVPASVAERAVIDLLKRRHRVAPDDERAFGHHNTEEEFGKIRGLFGGIRALIWIVGLGTLAAGVIGVSNIMLVIVRERTHEIGVRRAVGATPLSVMSQVIVEAVVLTGAAGYVGLIAGMGLTDVVARWMDKAGIQAQMFRQPGVSLDNALRTLAILVVCGTLAGIIPAQRAVRVKPVEALRAEP